MIMTTGIRGVEYGFLPGVGVSHLKETPTPGPICFIWSYV